MSLAPATAIHLSAVLGALAIGPVALWARQGAKQRPRLHRAFGYAWVTLMIVAAVSALFIPAKVFPLVGTLGPIHLLCFGTLAGLAGSFYFLAKGNIRAHRQIMQGLYYGACIGAGVFTLLPGRFLGELLWVDLLGLLPPHVHTDAVHGPSMISTFFSTTPGWVFAVLGALIAARIALRFIRRRAASASSLNA